MPEYLRRQEIIHPDFGKERAIGSQGVHSEVFSPEIRDTPSPIVYDDEVGKTTLAFHKIGAKNGIKAYDITYQHSDNQSYSLSQFLGGDFFFHWTNRAKFATLADDGETPAVFVDYDTLASSRRHLLSLGHEMGHTHQRDVDKELWGILGTTVTPEQVVALQSKYPTLEDHIKDLIKIRLMCAPRTRAELDSLAQGIIHKPTTGFDTRGIDTGLPKFADGLQKLSASEAPVGPTHLYNFFLGKHFQRTLPGVYQILDAMGEQRAWELAMGLEAQGVIHTGFSGSEERVEFMRSGLTTYDETYQTKAYTRWLDRYIYKK